MLQRRNFRPFFLFLILALGAGSPGNAAKKGDPLHLGVPGAEAPERYYFENNLVLDRDLVIDGPVIIVADRDVNPNNHSITISPAGHLTLYVHGNLNMHGKSAFNNNGKPANLVLYGTRREDEGQQDLVITGNGIFSGVVYAPNAHVMSNGGGTDGATYGSIVAKQITFNGSPGPFHFDESLLERREGEDSTFRVEGYYIPGRPSESVDLETVDGDYRSIFPALFEN